MADSSSRPLAGKIAVVAGATRGTGRGIAIELGAAGATVYCTGRSTREAAGERGPGKGAPFDLEKRPETIEESAELVTAAGGRGIPVRVDHLQADQVSALAGRVASEQGRLDILVNDIWGGEDLVEWGKAFWELEPDQGFRMVEVVFKTHVLTSRHLVPLILAGKEGLIVEVTDGDTLGYRGNLFYDLAKIIPIRLALAMAADLESKGHDRVTTLAVTPGFLRSEAMLDHFGVTEENWVEATRQVLHFSESETPRFVGRGVAALAADPRVHAKAGRVFASWTLAREYGFSDLDGRRPDFGAFFASEIDRILESDGPLTDSDRSLALYRYQQVHLDPQEQELASRLGAILGLSGRPSAAS